VQWQCGSSVKDSACVGAIDTEFICVVGVADTAWCTVLLAHPVHGHGNENFRSHVISSHSTYPFFLIFFQLCHLSFLSFSGVVHVKSMHAVLLMYRQDT
jgi:hypothetical protein